MALCLAQTNSSYWSTAKISTLFNYITIKLLEVNFEDQALWGMIVYKPGNFCSHKHRLGRHHLTLECIETVAKSSSCHTLKKFDSLWKPASIFGIYDFTHEITRLTNDSSLLNQYKSLSGREYGCGSLQGGRRC